MSVTRVGATKQYSDNWDNIFAGATRRSSAKNAATKRGQKSAKKSSKSTAKSANKKRAATAKRKAR
jgi:hypothetical protein